MTWAGAELGGTPRRVTKRQLQDAGFMFAKLSAPLLRHAQPGRACGDAELCTIPLEMELGELQTAFKLEHAVDFVREVGTHCTIVQLDSLGESQPWWCGRAGPRGADPDVDASQLLQFFKDFTNAAPDTRAHKRALSPSGRDADADGEGDGKDSLLCMVVEIVRNLPNLVGDVVEDMCYGVESKPTDKREFYESVLRETGVRPIVLTPPDMIRSMPQRGVLEPAQAKQFVRFIEAIFAAMLTLTYNKTDHNPTHPGEMAWLLLHRLTFLTKCLLRVPEGLGGSIADPIANEFSSYTLWAHTYNLAAHTFAGPGCTPGLRHKRQCIAAISPDQREAVSQMLCPHDPLGLLYSVEGQEGVRLGKARAHRPNAAFDMAIQRMARIVRDTEGCVYFNMATLGDESIEDATTLFQTMMEQADAAQAAAGDSGNGGGQLLMKLGVLFAKVTSPADAGESSASDEDSLAEIAQLLAELDTNGDVPIRPYARAKRLFHRQSP